MYVGKGGGIGPARKMAAVAEAAGLTCTVGSNLELGIASAAMTHLATATPGIGAEEFPCDILGPLAYEHDLLAEPLDFRDGSMKAPEGAGTGRSHSTRRCWPAIAPDAASVLPPLPLEARPIGPKLDQPALSLPR